MELKDYIYILVIILAIEPAILICLSFKKKNYYETYQKLQSNPIKLFFAFFYGVTLGQKILRDGIDLKYNWVNIEKEELLKYLNNNQVKASLSVFQTLDAFQIYLLEGNSKAFTRKKQMWLDESFFEELKKMNEKLEVNNTREN